MRTFNRLVSRRFIPPLARRDSAPLGQASPILSSRIAGRCARSAVSNPSPPLGHRRLFVVEFLIELFSFETTMRREYRRSLTESNQGSGDRVAGATTGETRLHKHRPHPKPFLPL
jgi:hypothetical protein